MQELTRAQDNLPNVNIGFTNRVTAAVGDGDGTDGVAPHRVGLRDLSGRDVAL